MAVIDISSKLGNKKPIIKLAEGKEYEVDTSADKVIIIQEKFSNDKNSIEDMYSVIELLMGQEALQTIKDMRLTVAGLTTVFVGLMAAVNEIPLEEMEKRFQELKK